ncbi:MAG: hypothetical protein GY856_00390 [bacterium]|nr:hypothetical protein [bacterium]
MHRSEKRCFLGLDMGRYSAKIFLISGDRADKYEVMRPHRGTPDQFLEKVVEEVRKLLAADRGMMRVLTITSNVREQEKENLDFKLTESLAPISGISIEWEPIKPSTAPLFAVRDTAILESPSQVLVLEVGHQETRCFELNTSGQPLEVEIGERLVVSRKFGGEAVTRGLLWIMEDFGLLGDVKWTDVRPTGRTGPIYQYAVDVKDTLAAGEEVVISPRDYGINQDEFRIESRTFVNNLFKHQEWKEFNKRFLTRQLKEFLAGREIPWALVCGGPCRLEAFTRRLLRPARLERLEILGGDPGFAGAVGLAIYGFHAQARARAPVEKATPHLSPSGGTRKLPICPPPGEPPEPIGETGLPAMKAVERPTGQLFLRMNEDLHPIFTGSPGTIPQPEKIPCAPLPAYLSNGAGAHVELQLFWEEPMLDARAAGWPRYVGRETIELPTERRFHLILELLGNEPLVIRVRVETEDGHVAAKSWEVPQRLGG